MLNRIVTGLIFMLPHLWVQAQCAMCKAGAEQSLERGSTAVHWINYAIIFLMTIPLVLILGLYLLYKYNKKPTS